MTQRLNWVRYGFLTPAFLFYVVFALGPMVTAAYFSLLNWNGLGTPRFIGFSNWQAMFSDPLAGQALVLTAKIMVLTWILQTPLSMAIGVFLAGRERYRAVLSVFYFTPLLFSSAAIGLAWEYILDPNFGVVDAALNAIGLSNLAQAWLGNPAIALYTVAAVIAWQFIPFHTLLYQAGTLQIPSVIYDAARIDGARGFRMFFNITLPQLRYTIVTSSILMLTGSLTYFDLIYVMTGGGPGYATSTLPLYMYKVAFPDEQVGYGSVFAVVLALVGIALSIVMLRVTGFLRMESQMEGA